MRNLKRALSLTLASVMLLGMMVVGSGAVGFPDVDKENNVEAIEVLNAVDVIRGYDNGDFGPDDLVTRSQMAVIMANLLNLDYQYYEATCPFTDVPAWARGYVGACYAKGITSGYSTTIYGANDGITPVQAASMMMRALGYFQYADDYKAGFELATVSQGTDIGIFEGVGSSATAQMTRDQVAQMALNALRSEMVRFTGTPGVEVNGVVVGYRAEYTPRTSTEAKYNAIEGRTSDVNATNQYYIQLGEELYNGNLKLYNHDTDAFDRPARTWEYKGEEIGTYVKKEMLRQSYSEKITGKTLYDLLTKNTIDTYEFVIAIDGVGTTDASAKTILGSAWFDTASMVRTNDKAVGGTGKGVTTEVYVDTTNKIVYISVINTYLAIAAEDYDEKNEDVDLTVYKINDAGSVRSPIYVKADDKEIINVSSEDFAVENVEKNDMFLVNVAEGEVQIMNTPEVVSAATISAFAKKDWVKADGSQYDYASTAMYDTKVLDKYDDLNMKELTYNVILDQYGCLIGLERNEDPDQYVFLTGLETGLSNLSSKNVDGNIIRMDGTMETVTIDLSKSKNDEGKALTDGTWYTNLSQLNTWCTYSVSTSGVYTLKQVKVATTTNPIPGNDLTAAQYAQDVGAYYDVGGSAGTKSINEKRVSLNAASANQYVYGNDKTVYINVELKKIPAHDTTGGNLRWIINDVESVTTGVKNVSLVMKDLDPTDGGYINPDAEIYTLYDEDGYVIAAVTIGEDEGTGSTFAYITSADVKYEEYGHGSGSRAADGKWAWYREAIVDGEKVMLTEGGDNLTMLGAASDKGNMKQGEWYEIRRNADGEVTRVEDISWAAADSTADAHKYIRTVLDVEPSVNDHTTVLLSDVTTATALRFNGDGTLYTQQAPSQMGFSVSPDVKVILATADEDRNEFDKVSDTYTGYAGLTKALNQMNADAAKFNARTVEVNAILNEGRAIVIVINDTNPANSKGTGISSGGGKYYDYEANIFSNGMARAIVNVTRPEWLDSGKDLNYSFDVMVNGKLYETVVGSTIKVASGSNTATATWSNWAGTWGVPFAEGDTVTIENFKWTNLTAQDYIIKFIDQNENELTVADKATADVLATDTHTTVGATNKTPQFKVNGGKYETAPTTTLNIIGVYDGTTHTEIKNVAVTPGTKTTANGNNLTVGKWVNGAHEDWENYVYVQIDLSKLSEKVPTYSVSIDTTDSFDSGVALSEFGITSATDKDYTLTVSLENGADDVAAGYRYDTSDIQITLDNAPSDVVSYKVTIEGMGSVIVSTNSATNLDTDTKLITLNDDLVITKDMVKVEVAEKKLAIESVSWSSSRLIINFSEEVDDTTVAENKFTFAVGTDADGGANTNASAVYSAEAAGKRITIEFSGDSLVAGNTIEVANSIATDTAANTLGAKNKVITLTADGKGTVADK